MEADMRYQVHYINGDPQLMSATGQRPMNLQTEESDTEDRLGDFLRSVQHNPLIRIDCVLDNKRPMSPDAIKQIQDGKPSRA
jgi:hypothetical protein